MNPFLRAAERRLKGAGLTGGVSSPLAAFQGALHNRLTADWILAATKSADQEIRQSLRTLKERSRELARNNPYANRYLEIKTENVLGDQGIQLQATVKDPETGQLNRRVNQAIEEGWKEFCEVGVCTVDGKSAFLDLESLYLQEEARDGDAFLRLIPGWRDNRFGLAFQMLDSDQVDLEYHEEAGFSPFGDRRNEIRMGIEVNEWGRPIAYHVFPNHPSEPLSRGTGNRIPIPADQVVHWYRPYRPGQTRGVPDFAPVLVAMKMLAGYEEAELVAARIAAAKGGFFERAPEGMDLAALDPEKSDRQFTMEVEPGLFESLPPGWKFSSWDPTHPTSAFPDFHAALVRTLATGLGTSYHILAQDLEGVSFSSIRQGMLSERDSWRRLQSEMLRHFHQRVFRPWLLWSVTTGALDLPTRNPADYSSVMWQPRGWDWVDPEKDMRSAAAEVRMGVNSRTRIAAARGRNLEDVLEEIAYEEQLAAAMGLTLSTDMSRSGGGDNAGASRDEDPPDALRQRPVDRGRIEHLLRSGERARTGRGRLHLNGITGGS